MEKKRDSFFLSNKKPNGNKENKETKQKTDTHNKRQKQFDENRGVKEKKPFDKKAYRLKKYSKKYKLDQWEEQRKKKLLHEYYKDTKKDSIPGSYKVKSFDEDNTDSTDGPGRFVRHPDIIENENNKDLKTKKDPYFKAKEQYKKIKQEKIEKKQEIEKMKEERKLKIQEYKKKKQDRFKKLSKKTKKGQPVMTGRLELLLEKIQKATK